jgi:dTMP kinase
MRGYFLTFEGGEGSGKSTQIKLLSSALNQLGFETLLTREPGGSALGERIRALLLDPSAKLDPVTQLFLFNAARRDHVVSLIEPALQKGVWVLSDRFADSSRAYQGADGHIAQNTIENFEKQAIGSTRPDLTFILDIAPKIGLARAHKRRGKDDAADAFEAADLTFHEKVREGFLAIAKAEPKRCIVLDASQSKVALHEAVLNACKNQFASMKKGQKGG